MIVFKSIKPTPFRSSIFREEVRTAAQAMAQDIEKDFAKTVKTWEHKPEFETEVKVGSAAGSYITGKAGITGGAEIAVTTDDEVYGYVDEGTRPHIIKPRRKGYPLRFNVGGRPKTKPRIIGSTAGKKGNREVRARSVHHPGTKAREFTKTIHKKYQKEFRKQMDAAMRRAAKRSGHSSK